MVAGDGGGGGRVLDSTRHSLLLLPFSFNETLASAATLLFCVK